MKKTQKERNYFVNSDTNKRYYTYDYYLKRTFGEKCAKIPLDAGFTCPNIDGRRGFGGCIYCSGRGSGDFAQSSLLPISEQYRITRERLSSKWSTKKCIPYFQAHTNTYATVDVLREKFEEALSLDGVVGMNIATRADCLEKEKTELLAELAKRTVLTVELGLQSIHDKTAMLINRCHSYGEFLDGYNRLRSASEKINICVHLIFGLPEESDDMMLETVKEVASLAPEQVKIHLLHVLRSSALGKIYEEGGYTPLQKERYVDLVVRALELLPPDTVIARLTGDGMADDLLAPEWSKKKVSVLNDIDKLMYQRDTYQGKYYVR